MTNSIFKDPYIKGAAIALGINPEEVTSTQRHNFKKAVFLLMYSEPFIRNQEGNLNSALRAVKNEHNLPEILDD